MGWTVVQRRQAEIAGDVDGVGCGGAETDGDSRRCGRDGLWSELRQMETAGDLDRRGKRGWCYTL